MLDPSTPFPWHSVIYRMEHDVEQYNIAYAAAVAAGLTPLVYLHSDLYRDTPSTVTTVATSYLECNPKTFHFVDEERQGGASSHRGDLASRVGGQDIADKLTMHLKGTPYEWMLDDKAESWPENV
jgi:hypothetical protein